MKWIIDFCAWLIWFILGGVKPMMGKRIKRFIPFQKPKREKPKPVYANWSEAEYKMHFRNAASNMGLMQDAEEWWYEQPYEWRKKREDEWKERYGK